MAKQPHATPLLDQLESGPWPSFVTGLKRLAKDKDYVVDLLGHLEHSYKTRKGYWKGGTVGVIGYGGGVIPRFTEIKNDKGEPKTPDALAALAYDATNILIEAIEKAGVDDATKVADAMAKGKFEAVSGTITFDEFHTPIKPVTVIAVKDGKVTFDSQVMP